jgi:hypothetical protein
MLVGSRMGGIVGLGMKSLVTPSGTGIGFVIVDVFATVIVKSGLNPESEGIDRSAYRRGFRSWIPV